MYVSLEEETVALCPWAQSSSLSHILLGLPIQVVSKAGNSRRQDRREKAVSENWGGHSEPVPRISVPRPDLPCVPILLSTDASVEDSVHPTQDGTDQEATSVLWRVLSSEAPSPSLGDFPYTKQSEPSAFEEAAPQIPGMTASGTPGEAQ